MAPTPADLSWLRCSSGPAVDVRPRGACAMSRNQSWSPDRALDPRVEARREARRARVRAWVPFLDPVTYWISGLTLAGVCGVVELLERFATWAGLA